MGWVGFLVLLDWFGFVAWFGVFFGVWIDGLRACWFVLLVDVLGFVLFMVLSLVGVLYDLFVFWLFAVLLVV